MSKQRTSRQRFIAVAILSLIAAGCAHKSSPGSQIDEAFGPFSTTRNQTVALAGSTKRSLDASDVNTLAVAYTALQEKANAYADFMVEAVTTSSFDPGRNTKYANDFASAIVSFDKSYASLVETHRTMLASSWVSPFAQSLQTRWNEYSGVIAKLTPQEKADLIKRVKRDTVWPNYEDIATEPVGSH